MRAKITYLNGITTDTFEVTSYDRNAPGALILTERLSSYGPNTRTTMIPWAAIQKVEIE